MNRWAWVLVVLALGGCSVTSTPNRLPLHCIKAHDEYHDDGNGGPIEQRIATICDEYQEGDFP